MENIFKERIYIPVTFDCSGAYTLRDRSIRKQAFPFDWNIKTLDSIYDLIKNDFKDIFSSEYLVFSNKYFIHKYDNNPSNYKDLIPVFNKKYNILFVHDFNNELNNEIIYDKYYKRIKKFKDIIENAYDIVFIYEYTRKSYIDSIYNHWLDFFDDKNIFNNISHSKSIEDIQELILFKYDKKVKILNIDQL